jgi:hypothetical protein
LRIPKLGPSCAVDVLLKVRLVGMRQITIHVHLIGRRVLIASPVEAEVQSAARVVFRDGGLITSRPLWRTWICGAPPSYDQARNCSGDRRPESYANATSPASGQHHLEDGAYDTPFRSFSISAPIGARAPSPRKSAGRRTKFSVHKSSARQLRGRACFQSRDEGKSHRCLARYAPINGKSQAGKPSRFHSTHVDLREFPWLVVQGLPPQAQFRRLPES